MTFEQFYEDIMNKSIHKPQSWRKGQFVFNYIEETYGPVARYVQFVDHIDCFYDDSKIISFLTKCYEHLSVNNIV